MGESGKKKHDFPRCKKTHPDKKAEVGYGLFQFCCGHARSGRHSHAVRAEHEGHTLCQIGREQRVDVVVERRVRYGGERHLAVVCQCLNALVVDVITEFPLLTEERFALHRADIQAF